MRSRRTVLPGGSTMRSRRTSEEASTLNLVSNDLFRWTKIDTHIKLLVGNGGSRLSSGEGQSAPAAAANTKSLALRKLNFEECYAIKPTDPALMKDGKGQFELQQLKVGGLLAKWRGGSSPHDHNALHTLLHWQSF